MVGIEFERTVGPKGQIVIPQEIRKATGITPRTHVLVMIEDHKIVIESEKMRFSEWLEEQVKKDGKTLGKIDFDKEYEEEIEERWHAATKGLSK